MIFDTDVLIWALRGNPGAARTIDSAIDRTLSVVSLMELLQGSRSKREAHQIRQSLLTLQFTLTPLSERIGSTAADLIEQHALSRGIQVADALIAATALESDQPLCTANTKHFRFIRALALTAFRPAA
jgi:hypothetical protein